MSRSHYESVLSQDITAGAIPHTKPPEGCTHVMPNSKKDNHYKGASQGFGVKPAFGVCIQP